MFDVCQANGVFRFPPAQGIFHEMNQNELNRAVARATGETVAMVKRLGFIVAEPTAQIEDPTNPRLGGRVIDWDEFELTQKESDDSSFLAEAAFC